MSAKSEELEKKILLSFSLKTVGRNSGFIAFNETHIIPSHTALSGVFSAERSPLTFFPCELVHSTDIW